MKEYFCLSEEQRMEIDIMLRRLAELCQILNAPMFASVAISDMNDKTEYNRIVFHPNEIILSDDQIARHIRISRGFEAVEKRNVVEISAEEIFG